MKVHILFYLLLWLELGSVKSKKSKQKHKEMKQQNKIEIYKSE